MISLEDFTAHAKDMISDVPKYITEAIKECPCKHCNGTGTTQLPQDKAKLERSVLIGLLVACGARTNHTFPGDPCIYCDGLGANLFDANAIAAQRFARDWHPELKDLFGVST